MGHHESPISDIRTKEKKKLKKKKSQNNVNLIYRAKKREEKSVVRPHLEKSPLNMKKSAVGLKRIKSSTALNNILKKYK